MSILVAGGAGYIGAHVVRLLLERGDRVIVVDDLSYGTPDRVEGAELVQLDVASGEAVDVLTDVMEQRGVTARRCPQRVAQSETSAAGARWTEEPTGGVDRGPASEGGG